MTYLKIKVPDVVSVKELHEHNLRYVSDMAAENDGDAEWACNGIEIFKDGCKSGQKDIGVHLLSKAWRSVDENADFDMCETCLQWTLYCKSSGTDLGVGNLEELKAKGIDLEGIDRDLLETLSRSSVLKNLPEIDENVSDEEWNKRLEAQQWIGTLVDQVYSIYDHEKTGYLNKRQAKLFIGETVQISGNSDEIFNSFFEANQSPNHEGISKKNLSRFLWTQSQKVQ